MWVLISLVEKSLLSFVMKTRLERKVIWNGSGRSCNSNTILDLKSLTLVYSVLGNTLSVDVQPARNNIGAAVIKANRERVAIRAQGVNWHPETPERVHSPCNPRNS